MSSNHTGNSQPSIDREEHRTVGSVSAKATANYRFDGTNLLPETAKEVAQKITVVGSVTYVASAPVGTAQASALWQVKKIDATTGTVITWADGNANFDNVATDLTVLAYS